MTSDLQKAFDALSGSHDGRGEHTRQHPCSKQLRISAEDKCNYTSSLEKPHEQHRHGATTYVRISSGLFCCSFLPSPNPKKQTANMGVTPMTGAAMPL